MYDNEDRPHGVTVYPMTHNDAINGPVIAGRYALMVRRGPDGKIDPSEVRMVHSEGVQYRVTDEKPWVWSDYAPPGTVESFTPDELIQCIDSSCDLADWIRTFGSRLESNFWLAYRWATENVKV
jgi:hypothetical protein